MRWVKLLAKRTVRVITLVVIVTLVLAGASLLAALRTGPGQRLAVDMALDRLRGSIEGDVRVGSIVPGPDLSGSLGLTDVQVIDRTGGMVFQADSLRLNYSLFDILRGRYELTRADVWGGRVHIVRLADGQINAASLLPPSDDRSPRRASPVADSTDAPGRPAPAAFAIHNLSLHDTHVLVDTDESGNARPFEIADLEASLPEVRLGTPDGDRFELESASAMLDPERAEVRVEDVQGVIRRAGSRLVADLDVVALDRSRGTGALSVRWGSDDGVRTEVNGELAQLDFADFRWAEPDLPDGWASGHVTAVWSSGERQIRLDGVSVVADAGSVDASGVLDLDRSPSAHGLDLHLEGVDLAQLAPWIGDWAQGIVEGDLRLDGSAHGLSLDGDLVLAAADDSSTATPLTVQGRLRSEPTFAVEELVVASPRVDYRLLARYAPDLRLAGSGPITLSADGALADSMALAVDLAYADGTGGSSRAGWSGWIRRDSVGPTYVDGRASVADFRLAALDAYAPEAGLRGTVDGSFTVRGPLSDLRIDTDLETSGGPLSLAARFDATQPGSRVALEGPLRDFRPEALWEGAPERTRLFGRVSIAATGPDLASATGTGALQLDPGSRVGGLDLGPARFRGRLRNGVVEVDTLTARTAAGLVRGSGTLALVETAPRGELHLDVSSESLAGLSTFVHGDSVIARDSLTDFDREVLTFDGIDPDTLPSLDDLRLGGSGEGRLTLGGWIGALDVEGAMELSDVLYGRYGTRSANLRLTGRGLPAGTLEADVEALGASLYDRPFERIEADMSVADGRGEVDVFMVRDSASDLRARMVVDRDSTGTQVHVDQLTLRADDDRWNLGGPGTVAFGDWGWSVRDFQFVRPGQQSFRLRVHGVVPREGDADLSIEARRTNLGRMARLVQVDEEITGTFDLTLEASGDVQNPRVRLSLAGDSLGFRSAAADDLEGNVEYADGDLAGAVQADLDGKRVLEARGSAPFRLSLSPFALELRDEGQVDVDLIADSLPLGIALGMTPAFDEVEGLVDGQIHLGGSPSDLVSSGDLTVADGALALPGLGIHPREAGGVLTLQEDGRVDVNLRFEDEGLAAVTGSVNLRPLRDPGFDLTISATRLRGVDRRDVAARLSGEVQLEGSYSAPRISGALLTEGAVLYVEEFRDRSLTLDLTDPILLELIQTDDAVRPVIDRQNPFLRNLAATVSLKLERDTWLRSEAMNVELDGDLEVVYDRGRGSLSMLGTLDAVRGTYRVGGRQFNVQDGEIEFFGSEGVNPTLDIRAVTRLRRADEPLDIFADVTGTLLQPNVRLSSDEAGLTQGDLLSYIVFGRPTYGLTAGEQAAFQSAAGGAVAAGLGPLASTVSSAVGDLLPLDYLSVSAAQTTAGDAYAIGGGLAATQVELGKYLTQDLFVSVLLEPVPREGQDIFSGIRGELSLGDKWSLQSYYENQFARQRVTSFSRAFEVSRVLGVFLFRDWIR